jgi:4'-phosphopantetheinyl transferase
MQARSVRKKRDILSHMSALALARGDVRVFYADAPALIARSGGVERVLACLQQSEPERFTRYRADADRLMFLCGRMMARVLVGRALGVPASAWRWREGPHGRPEIAAPDTTVRFNLSHSAGLVACALADGRDVGVDVEHLLRPPVDRQMIRRYLSPAEAADVEAQAADRWQERFLVYWTLKEAYLKARGMGISLPLAEITFHVNGASARVSFAGSLADADTRWRLELARPTPRHLLSVAASTTDAVRPVITIAPLDEDLGGLFV